MRKWMRDRLRRRKKDSAETEKKPVPLQPAYFGEEPVAPGPSPDQIQAGPPPSQEPPQAEAGITQSVEAPTQNQAAASRRRRRRRGRGGRRREGSSSQIARASQQNSAQAMQADMAPPAAEEQPLAAQAPTPAATRPVTPGVPKGVVILAIGLPGSGKSSWFKRHNIRPLSSDMLRALLFDDPTEQRYQDLIFSNLRSMLKARLIARRPINYVDATNLTPHERHSWIKLAKDYGYEVQAVFFDVPLEVCLERNRRRERIVGEDVMRRMAARLRPPTFDEGFAKITIVRVKRRA
jgi:predicted kinase